MFNVNLQCLGSISVVRQQCRLGVDCYSSIDEADGKQV